MVRGKLTIYGYRLAFALLTVVLLCSVVLVPLTIVHVGTALLGRAAHSTVPLTEAPLRADAPTQTYLHVVLQNLEETSRTLTLRVTGYHVCNTGCDEKLQVLLFALRENERDADGLPPFVAIPIPTQSAGLSESPHLLAHGLPDLYPFDTYKMQLGLGVVRVAADGKETALSASEVAGRVYVLVEDQLPRLVMEPPIHLDPRTMRGANAQYDYLDVLGLTFARPYYIKVLAVLLTLLIAVSAVLAVSLHPLYTLVLGAGGVIMGIWSVRSILTPWTMSTVTALDVVFSWVIMLMLTAMVGRAVAFLYERSALHWRGGGASPSATSAPSTQCDAAACSNPIVYTCARCRGAFCPRHVTDGPPHVCDGCAALAAAQEPPRYPVARE